jgi:hypothetical protein
MRNAWGLEGSLPLELGIMGLVFHFIEFGVEDRRSSQRAYHSLCLVNLHCMSSVWRTDALCSGPADVSH